jgi:hypothetical protein
MKLLDTSFLIDYESGEQRVKRYLTANDTEEFVTSAVCMKELAVGKHVIHEPTEADIAGDYGWLQIVPFTFEHAYTAGKMEAHLRTDDSVADRRLPRLAADVLIGATARRLGAAVVADDTSDYELLPGVDTESY